MSERIGICEQCGQRFGGIPDSVTALKVKCTECGGSVAIPPLPEAPTAATPPPTESPAQASPAPEASNPAAAVDRPPQSKPLAAPLGDAKAKGGNRPAAAKPVDRDVAAAKKPPLPKVAKPIVPLKPLAKLAKPIKPIKPLKSVAKPAKPVVLLKKPATAMKPLVPAKPMFKPVTAAKPVAKIAPPAKPVAKPTPPVVKKPLASVAPAAKPKVGVAAKNTEPAKPSAAEIIAKAKAKKAEKSAVAKPSAADIIAKAKAKRAKQSAPAATQKLSAAEIIAQAKARRENDSASAVAKPAAKKSALPSGRPKVVAGGARKRPAASGGSSSPRGRRRREEKDEVVEKSKAPLLIVGALVLGGGGFGIWTLMNGAESETDNNGTDAVVSVPAEAATAPSSVTTNPSPAGNTTPAVSSSNDAGSATPDDAVDSGLASSKTTPGAVAQPKPTPSAKASSEFTLPAAGERINTRGVTDAALIRLDQVTPVAKASDTSDDQWNEAMEDLALYLEDSGASSNRAGNRLAEDYPRAAYPAIINSMLKADYSTPEGLYQVAALNNLLLRIGTKDLSWRQTEFFEPGSEEWGNAVAFDKKVVAAWHNLWVETYANSLPAWNGFSKVAAAAAAAGQAEDAGGIVGPDEDMFD